jgi:hypothetical protein
VVDDGRQHTAVGVPERGEQVLASSVGWATGTSTIPFHAVT